MTVHCPINLLRARFLRFTELFVSGSCQVSDHVVAVFPYAATCSDLEMACWTMKIADQGMEPLIVAIGFRSNTRS